MADGSAEAGAIAPASTVVPKGIAICGSHPETKAEAPFNRPDWLIYACSPDNSPFAKGSLIPRFDVWFELHKPIAHPSRPYGYLRWLEDAPVVYMRDESAMPFFKGAVLYPEEDVKKRWGPYLFTSSLSYMLAKAIMDCEAQGIRNIGVFGVMQSSKDEYLMQRTGTQQFLYEASKSGITVHLPKPALQLAASPPENW